jgi:hypothetical protein
MWHLALVRARVCVLSHTVAPRGHYDVIGLVHEPQTHQNLLRVRGHFRNEMAGVAIVTMGAAKIGNHGSHGSPCIGQGASPKKLHQS